MNVNDRTKLTREEEHPFKDTRFAYGLGKGLGHDFLHMDERLKEQVFEKVAYDHFALGLGEGLGRIYDSLEGVVQNKLLEYARLYSTFAYGLGKGLGLGFPSMSRNVQSRVLNI